MTAHDIVEDYLQEHGFDGLFSIDGDCACDLAGGLAPCGGPFGECEPGYKFPCPKDCGEHEYHIGEAEQVAKAKGETT